MAECAKCGFENPNSNRFCGGCGEYMVVVCSRCRWSNPTDHTFCGNCGERLEGISAQQKIGSTTVSSGAGRVANLESVHAAKSPQRKASDLPEQLANKLRKIKDRVPGERKHITVLFADIMDSTALTESKDVEDAFGLLATMVDCMCEAVHRHDGIVSKVLGDGIMAIFGAPIAYEDHATRACRAAVEMRDALFNMMPDQSGNGCQNPSFRIGLNSGEVVVLSIGDDLNMDYDAIGPTVHLAARMEQTADPGKIQITNNTFRLAEAVIATEDARSVEVKGFSTPVKAFVLKEVRPEGQRIETSIRSGLNRLRGRDREMGGLRDALDAAMEQRGAVVGLVGAPGVGKSRLAYEASQLASKMDFRHFFVAGSPEYLTRPMHIVRMLLRNVLAIPDSAKIDEVLKRLEALTGRDKGYLQPFVIPIASELDCEIHDKAWNVMEPAVRRAKVSDAIVQFLIMLGERTPTMLAIEDVQWIDPESQDILEALVPAISGNSLLLVLTFRPEFHETWEQRGHYRRMYVDALSETNAREMVDDILGSDGSLDTLRSKLVTATGGIPLFIEESIRTLLEDGQISGDKGRYTAARHVEEISLPLTVQAILEARIDLLSQQMKEVLHSAAVIGRTAPEETLRFVSGQDSSSFEDSIFRLEDLDFLRESQIFPRREYSFLQNITRDVAYAGLVKNRRLEFHRRVVEFFEDGESPSRFENQDELVAILAHHSFKGELWTKAVTYFLDAARRAVGKWANKAALTALASALEALQNASDAEEISPLEADIRRLEIKYLIAQCRYSLGEFDASLQTLNEEKDLIERVANRSLAAQCHFWISHIQCRIGESGLAAEAAKVSAQTAQAVGDLLTEGKANASLSLIYYQTGDCASGLEAGSRAIELLTKAGDEYWLGMSHFYVGMIYMIADHTTKAAQIADTVIEIGQRITNPRLQCYGMFLLGWAAVASGDAERGVLICGEAEQNAPDATSRAYARAFEGYAMLEAGQTHEARELLNECTRAFEQFNFPIFTSWFGALHAEAIRRSGDADAAAKAAEKSLAIAERINHPWGKAWAHGVLGRLNKQSKMHLSPDQNRALADETFRQIRDSV